MIGKIRIAFIALTVLAAAGLAGVYFAPQATAGPGNDCDQQFIDCINAGHSASFCEVERTACRGGSTGGGGGGTWEPSCGQIYWACIDAGYPQTTCERARDDCSSGGRPGMD